MSVSSSSWCLGRAAVCDCGTLWTFLKYLRMEIKDDIKKQHDLYVNNWVGDVKANPKDFYIYIIV